jgi:cysteine-rich repeat protein
MLATLAWLGACAADEDDVAGTAAYSAPPGSNAAVVSHTVPTTMAPGERLLVQVTMQNTGDTPGTNDWVGSAGYELRRLNSTFGWVSTPVTGTVPVGSQTTFTFAITAPSTPGTYTFGAQMSSGGASNTFGQQLTVPNIVVSASTTPQYRCTFLPGSSTLPSTMAPGENRAVTLTVQNTGTQAWTPASEFFLRSQDVPTNRWSQTSASLTAAVPAGATASFNVSITAPSTPGTYSFKRQMWRSGPLGFFAGSCIDEVITVGGTSPLDAVPVANTIPTDMAPDEPRTVTVTFQNTGSLNWPGDGSIVLASQSSPPSLWGTTTVPLNVAVPVGNTHTFNFNVRAPSTPGTYQQVWRMRALSGPNAGFFGTPLSVNVTVSNSTTPEYGAAVVSQSIPTLITVGTTRTFSITMQNTGTKPWTGSNFALGSVNTPVNLWGVTNVKLGGSETVSPGATRTFAFNVIAPTTPGTYVSAWRMRQIGGVGFFGPTAITTGIVVTLCGNGVLDPGETCDDGNLTASDGCSPACALEQFVSDRLTDTTGHVITGSQTNKQLAPVGLGDFDGDSTIDVLVGEIRNVSLGGTRNQAGIVAGFTGGAGFFDNASSVVTSGAAFTILGADPNDNLGATGAGFLGIADVTGDAQPEVIVSAAGADGPSNGRPDAGEVYVLAGPALSGDVDLRTASGTVLLATVVGAAAGDRLRLLAVADVTGDGRADLVMGAPGHDAAGTDAGAIFILPGGSLSGTIDLSTAGAVRIDGAAAGDGLGVVAAVGDLSGDGQPDLLTGAPLHNGPNGSKSGGAWAVFGPVTSGASLALAAGSPSGPSVAWFGAGANDKLGATVAVGHVTGTAAADALVAATQQRKAGQQVGAVNVFAGHLVSGTTYDLATDIPTATLLGEDAYDVAGTALALGDVNGDGVLDIGVCAAGADGPAEDRDGAGVTYVVLGRAALSGTIDLAQANIILHGAAARDLMGNHPNNLALGDIDGDGLADVAVGSFRGGTSGSLTSPGRVDFFPSPF